VKYYISSEAPEIDGCIETRTMEKKAKESAGRERKEKRQCQRAAIFSATLQLSKAKVGGGSALYFSPSFPRYEFSFLTFRFFVSNFPCLETLGMATQ
jgi:hypothetical protein